MLSKHYFFLLITILITFTLTLDNDYYVLSSFTSGYFKIMNMSPDIYNLNIGFKDIPKGQRPIAFGSLSKNMNSDVVSVSDDYSTLYIWTYNTNLNLFQLSKKLMHDSFSNGAIISVIITDLIPNKQKNLLVIVRNKENSNKIDILLFVDDESNNFTLRENYSLRSLKKQQPFMFSTSEHDNKNTVHTTYLMIDDIKGTRYRAVRAVKNRFFYFSILRIFFFEC